MSRGDFPSAKQDTYVRYTIRVPPTLYERVQAAAAVSGRSVNAEIVHILSSGNASLRDQFAIHALAGMMASESDESGHYQPSSAASRAYQFADAMMKARQP